MKSFLIYILVLLVVTSKHVILSNKNDTTVLTKDKLSLYSNEEFDEQIDSKEAKRVKLSKNDGSQDTSIISTTIRPSRQSNSTSSAQERDKKLMNLLAARRSALRQDRFRTHNRAATTGRTRAPIESTSKSPPDVRTLCVRNCTKNFTRRTTASCMRQCTSIQRRANATSHNNPISEEEKSQKDNNEILFTDESSHGFFVVAKDVNDTMNHIPELRKGTLSGSPLKAKQRHKQSNPSPHQSAESDSYVYFGRKIPSLRPSFLSISTVSDEHPQVFEVSVSQKPPSSKAANKFNPRERFISSNTRKFTAAKINPLPATLLHPLNDHVSVEKVDEMHTSSMKNPSVAEIKVGESTLSSTVSSVQTPSSSIVPEKQQLSTTEKSLVEVSSTPLIISVIDEDSTTNIPPQEHQTESNGVTVEEMITDLAKVEAPAHFSEDKTNLIIFLNKSMEAMTSSPGEIASSTIDPGNSNGGIKVLRTTILSSVRSTVYPPTITRKSKESASENSATNSMEQTSESYDHVETTRRVSSEGSNEIKSKLPDRNDTTRLNIATYVLAGLGMLPVLVVVVYLMKSVVWKEYSKHDEDFDVCITDQQPISPVKKVDQYDDEDESGKYDKCSISSMDEFNRSNLRLKSLLGEGNFGQVWKAEADDLSGHVGATRIVAVKTVRSGSSQDGLKEEATIMRKLGSHPNVVTLLGACIESEPHMLIMEFAMRGRLLSLLRAARSATNILPASVPGGKSLAPLSPRTLAGFALDIAAGMEYIADKKIVHRDLAARNVLIDHNGVCKICDFGMSMDLDVFRKKQEKERNSDVMRSNSNKFDKLKFDLGERIINHWTNGLSNPNPKKTPETLGRRPALPIRWMAPESLQYNEFSIETDIWAFGIVLWEIATLGATPYANLSGREVVRHVLQGTRPELPKDGRHGFFDLMLQCWHKVPEHRPTFREARLEISRFVCKWMDDDAATSDYMDVSGFSEDLEHGMVYFNQRISEFECEI